MNRLKNKRALITGGTSGIGLATARHFLREGARVAITGTNQKALESAKSELGNVVAIRADAGVVAEQKRVADDVKDAFGGLDILFVNAGIGDFRPLERWDEAGFDRSMAINLKGPFFLVQALLPLLANPAAIVFNTSINAHIGMASSSVYGVAGLIAQIPAGRRGTADEIASAVTFLAADEAAFTVGSELIIDGGMTTL